MRKLIKSGIFLRKTWVLLTTRREVKKVKSRIIKQAVELIPKYGYSIDCLGRAAEKCGYPFTTHGLFPDGPMNLIDHIMSDGMNEMRTKFIEKKEEMAQKNERLGMTASVKLLCQYRLTYMKPFIRQWHEGLAVMALPHNVPKSLQHLAELVDEMWFLAGDRSYDFNYYTKRALLSSVYTTTELYMMTDTSPDFEATMKFLDRRLEDTAIFGKAVNDAVGFGNYVLKSWDGILASRGLVK
ncbi:COQ9-domain-containing protein [Paraphysoderma sedebokerense]|nr:COQ9-domain-containing protein [Paraphysoderma sedebokerense]